MHSYPLLISTDYRHPVRKSPSLHSQKSNPNPKLLGTAEAYFVCHIGPKFQIFWFMSSLGVSSPSLYLIASELIIPNTQSACFHYCHFTALKVHLFKNMFPESRLKPKMHLEKGHWKEFFFLFLQPQDSIEAASAGENWPQWIRRAMIIGHRRRRRRSQERPDHSGTFEQNSFHISNLKFGLF